MYISLNTSCVQCVRSERGEKKMSVKNCSKNGVRQYCFILGYTIWRCADQFAAAGHTAAVVGSCDIQVTIVKLYTVRYNKKIIFWVTSFATGGKICFPFAGELGIDDLWSVCQTYETYLQFSYTLLKKIFFFLFSFLPNHIEVITYELLCKC